MLRAMAVLPGGAILAAYSLFEDAAGLLRWPRPSLVGGKTAGQRFHRRLARLLPGNGRAASRG